MDVEFIKWIASLGVGGALAYVIFHFHLKLTDKHTEDLRALHVSTKEDLKDLHRQTMETLTAITIRNNERESLLVKSLQENTVSHTRLVTVIDALHSFVGQEVGRRRTDQTLTPV